MAIFKSMFKKTGYIKIGSQPEEKGPSVPDGMWLKCSKCKKMVYREDVKEKFYTCPKCGDYFRIKAKTRLRLLLDKGSFQEWGTDIEEKNPIDFPEYEEKLSDTRRKTGLKEAVTIGKGSICGWETVIGVCDARFLMSSMGYVVGERITQAFEQATEEKLPVILFCWGENAGRDYFSDADGKNSSGNQTSQRCRPSLHSGADGSDNGWCDGKFCHAWRCDPCRARSPGWICRSSCYPSDNR